MSVDVKLREALTSLSQRFPTLVGSDNSGAETPFRKLCRIGRYRRWPDVGDRKASITYWAAGMRAFVSFASGFEESSTP
jgi:hypothetical protein